MDPCESVVILDFETTGLSSEYNRVIEVGAVALDGNLYNGEFSELMDPGDFLPYQITSITGITDEMLFGKPTPEEVMPKLKEFIGNRTIIAHNAVFDWKFLNAEMKRAGYDELTNPLLCTLKLSRRLLPQLPSYSLTNLKTFLNIQVERSHRAIDDAKATAYLWRHLCEVLKVSVSDPNLIDLDLMQKVSTISKHQTARFLSSL